METLRNGSWLNSKIIIIKASILPKNHIIYVKIAFLDFKYNILICYAKPVQKIV